MRQSNSNMYDWYKPTEFGYRQYVCSDNGLINYLYRNQLVDTDKYSCPLWDMINKNEIGGKESMETNVKMQIEVVKEFSFDAAHFLPRYEGKCKKIHGHRWVLHVGVKGYVNPTTGMVIDFVEIKHIINQLIVDKLDHEFLNKVEEGFPKYSPTAENILIWIIGMLEAVSARGPFIKHVSFVRLYESPTSYVEWRRENV